MSEEVPTTQLVAAHISADKLVAGTVHIRVSRWRRFKHRLREWFLRPAPWWQFWRPASGFIGGIILCAVVTGGLLLLHALAIYLLWIRNP